MLVSWMPTIAVCLVSCCSTLGPRTSSVRLLSNAVHAGDRIAQLIIEKISTPEIEEVDSLEDTDRGSGGFGSTGGFKSQ